MRIYGEFPVTIEDQAYNRAPEKIRSSNLGIEGNFLNLILKHLQKKNPIFNIILNCEKLGAYLLRLRTKQECPFSPLLFNIVLEVLVNAVGQEKERKGIQIGKEEIKQSFFTDDIIISVENLKELTKRLLELIMQL